MYKYLQSVFDYLVVLLPDNKIKLKERIDPKAANNLFSIWKNEDNRIDGQTYRRPMDFPGSDVEIMERAGLVKSLGDRVEITQKGAEVIRVMVLGDDKSIFEDDDKIVDYHSSLANVSTPAITAGRKLLTSKKNDDVWWKRFI